MILYLLYFWPDFISSSLNLSCNQPNLCLCQFSYGKKFLLYGKLVSNAVYVILLCVPQLFAQLSIFYKLLKFMGLNRCEWLRSLQLVKADLNISRTAVFVLLFKRHWSNYFFKSQSLIKKMYPHAPGCKGVFSPHFPPAYLGLPFLEGIWHVKISAHWR